MSRIYDLKTDIQIGDYIDFNRDLADWVVAEVVGLDQYNLEVMYNHWIYNPSGLRKDSQLKEQDSRIGNYHSWNRSGCRF